MLARKAKAESGIANLAELLEIMSFYRQVRPGIRTLDLLRLGGFKIKGLRDGFQPIPGSHYLAWNEKLGYGICTCGWRAKEEWPYEKVVIQHGIHKGRTY